MDDARTWVLIHRERGGIADTLSELTPEQWEEPGMCAGWSVHVTAGHILVGAEQTPGRFLRGMAANGFRFNTMMDRDSRRAGALAPDEIVERLRATTTTTNHPPAPVMTMLGEVVVHGEEIRFTLGRPSGASPEALVACLEMYRNATFPVGTKKRIDGLRMIATDVDWTHGTGPEVAGAAVALLLAMTGRAAALRDLDGAGREVLGDRLAPAARPRCATWPASRENGSTLQSGILGFCPDPAWVETLRKCHPIPPRGQGQGHASVSRP